MAEVTLNGKPVQSLQITMPQQGAWSAHAVLDTRDTVTGTALLTGSITLVGHVQFGESYLDSQHVRVVGGAGGLGTELTPRGYKNASVRIVLGDVLSACGERLSLLTSPTLLTRSLAHWVRSRATGGQALTVLTEYLGVTWRVLDDGSIWLGTDSFIPQTFTYLVTSREPESKCFTISSESAFARPGLLVELKRIVSVLHTIEGKSLRSVLIHE